MGLALTGIVYAYTPLLAPSGGGTGTSTAPTLGQILVGTSAGIYAPSSTSTLGLGSVTSVGASVPTGLSISGSPITGAGTLAFTLSNGYVIPLSASTTEWAAASASTTALTPSYIRGLISNTATGLTYSAGVLSLTSGYNIPLTASTSDFQTAFTNRITSASSPLSISGNVLSISTTPTFASTTLSNFTTGSIPFFGSGGSLAQNNSNLFWDNTNSRLGLGTTSPLTVLDVWGKFNVATGTTPALTVDTTNGSVGINTSAPTATYKLDVGGNLNTTGYYLSGTQTLFTSTNNLNVRAPSGKFIAFLPNAAESVRLDSTGNVGIGTTTPSARLAITGTAGTGDIFAVASSTETRLVTVKNTGNVGIATTTPDSKLDINGSVRFESASSTLLSPSISGAIVGLGCDTATTSVDTTFSSSTTAFITTPQVFPGAGLFWQSYLSSSGVITTEVCSTATVTPTASQYIIKIIK